MHLAMWHLLSLTTISLRCLLAFFRSRNEQLERTGRTSRVLATAAKSVSDNCLIFQREGTLFIETVMPALPATWPQVVFAALVLLVGVATGQISGRAERPHHELVLTNGAGI